MTPGGQIMLEMVDYYGGTVLILALTTVEVIAINWIYGTSQLARDFNFMLQMQLSVYWRFCWGVLCPILLPLLFLYVLFTQAGVPDIPFPAQVAGWLISLIGQYLRGIELEKRHQQTNRALSNNTFPIVFLYV